jgi:hypothetical protein
VVASVVTLSSGYAAGAMPFGWLVFGAIGILWIALHVITPLRANRIARFVNTLAWLALTLAAAIGTTIGLSAVLMLAGLILALCVWDLTDLAHRLNKAQQASAARPLVLNHMRWLFLWVMIASLATLLTLTIRIEIGFVLLVVLGMLAVLAIGRATRLLSGE